MLHFDSCRFLIIYSLILIEQNLELKPKNIHTKKLFYGFMGEFLWCVFSSAVPVYNNCLFLMEEDQELNSIIPQQHFPWQLATHVGVL